MGLFSNSSKFAWTELSSQQQLNDLLEQSSQKTVVIFKHSTRCNISAMIKTRLEGKWNPDTERSVPVYLDLLAHRNLSDKLAEMTGIRHESPQVLIFRNGEVVYNASHGMIEASTIEQQINAHL